jgi:hypothetical protein
MSGALDADRRSDPPGRSNFRNNDLLAGLD